MELPLWGCSYFKRSEERSFLEGFNSLIVRRYLKLPVEEELHEFCGWLDLTMIIALL